MTELNKRSPELQPVTVPAFVVNEYNQLKLENIALKEQLRWRPVSEKPEKAGVVAREASWRLLMRSHAAWMLSSIFPMYNNEKRVIIGGGLHEERCTFMRLHGVYENRTRQILRASDC